MKLIPNLSPIDHQAIEVLGIPSLDLMERAGGHVAQAVLDRAKAQGLPQAVVTIVCGKGQNGGDGFVCARWLAQKTACQVQVVCVASPQDLVGDARVNFERLEGLSVRVLVELPSEAMASVLQTSDIVVDALFGSGLSRPIEGIDRLWVQAMNVARGFTVSVDLPSGIDSTTGSILGVAVCADITVTFATAKPGLYLAQGKAHAGRVHVVDIGIPPHLIDEDPSQIQLLTPEWVRASLPVRPRVSHKHTYGSVLVVAGSKEMPGAAVMAAEAALRAGAGMVRLASTPSAFLRMTLPPEVMCLTLPETETGEVAPEALDRLTSVLGQSSGVLVGPGLSMAPSVQSFVEGLLGILREYPHVGVVVDADGLNALALCASSPTLDPRFILTPHLGEAARLLTSDKSLLESNLLAAHQALVQRYGATVILKSASTVLGGPGTPQWINPTGNPGMATAGSGDVLAGLVAGFQAQGLLPHDAACVGTYLHGLAGDQAAQTLTPYALTATDILKYLPQALQAVMESP